jgi:hypothetical protein
MACLRMALTARDGHAPSLFTLLDGCLDYGGYTEEPGGRVTGLLYRQFADFTRDCFHLRADVIADLDPARITRELDQGRLVMVRRQPGEQGGARARARPLAGHPATRGGQQGRGGQPGPFGLIDLLGLTSSDQRR